MGELPLLLKVQATRCLSKDLRDRLRLIVFRLEAVTWGAQFGRVETILSNFSWEHALHMRLAAQQAMQDMTQHTAHMQAKIVQETR